MVYRLQSRHPWPESVEVAERPREAPSMRYRLTTPLTAIRESDGNGRRTLLSIPVGAIVQVVSEAQGSGLVEVSFDGETVSIFLKDLENRSEVIEYNLGASADGNKNDALQ